MSKDHHRNDKLTLKPAQQPTPAFIAPVEPKHSEALRIEEPSVKLDSSMIEVRTLSEGFIGYNKVPATAPSTLQTGSPALQFVTPLQYFAGIVLQEEYVRFQKQQDAGTGDIKDLAERCKKVAEALVEATR